MEKTAAQLIDELDWTQKDARSPYDRAIFLTLQALQRELALAYEEIAALREDVAAALVSGGTLG
jgi:hypothetical protein